MLQAATSKTSTDKKVKTSTDKKVKTSTDKKVKTSTDNNGKTSTDNKGKKPTNKKQPDDSSLDEDVTFERMRCQSNKGKFYSVHKQLTWQRQKTLRQFERDHDLAAYNLCREKSCMQERLAKLKEIQKHNQRAHQSDLSLERNSEPTLKIQGILKPYAYHGSHHKDDSQQAGTSSRKTSDPNAVVKTLGNKSAGSLLVSEPPMMTQSESTVPSSLAG